MSELTKKIDKVLNEGNNETVVVKCDAKECKMNKNGTCKIAYVNMDKNHSCKNYVK